MESGDERSKRRRRHSFHFHLSPFFPGRLANHLTARENERIYDVRKKMRARGVRRIPVVDTDGRLQGIIAFDDLVDWMAQELTDLAQLVSREQQRESEIP